MCSKQLHTQEGWEQQMLEVAVQLVDVSGLIAIHSMLHLGCCIDPTAVWLRNLPNSHFF